MCFKLISSRKPAIGNKFDLLLQSVIPVFGCMQNRDASQGKHSRVEWGVRGERCEAKTVREVKRTCAWFSTHSRMIVILS